MSPLDDNDRNEINKTITDAIAEANKSVPTTEAITTAVTAAIEEKVPGMIDDKVKDLKPPAKDPGDDSSADDKPPVWAKGFIETLADIKKRQDEMTAESEGRQRSAETESKVESWLKANRPNLSEERKTAMSGRLIARFKDEPPKDDAAINAAFESVVEEAKAWGADVKPFSADAEKEGKKPRDDAKEESEEKCRRIREEGPGAPV